MYQPARGCYGAMTGLVKAYRRPPGTVAGGKSMPSADSTGQPWTLRCSDTVLQADLAPVLCLGLLWDSPTSEVPASHYLFQSRPSFLFLLSSSRLLLSSPPLTHTHAPTYPERIQHTHRHTYTHTLPDGTD